MQLVYPDRIDVFSLVKVLSGKRVLNEDSCIKAFQKNQIRKWGWWHQPIYVGQRKIESVVARLIVRGEARC